MALSVEENELITHVGPGTPCGEMMRRYWHPDRPQRRAQRSAASPSLAGRRLGRFSR